WPGGCFADEYHWKDGIGPREDRPRVVNSHWGDVVEDNSFGTHEFMDLVELLGTEAYVNGNAGSGTVQEMSEWIEYLTRADDSPMAAPHHANGRDEAWKVPFFGIGNESWGCGGNMRAEDYTALARQYSTFVREHAGNQVTRIAGGANVDDYGWTEALMKDAGPHLPYQAISLHNYTFAHSWEEKGSARGFSDEEWYSTLANAAACGWTGPRMKAAGPPLPYQAISLHNYPFAHSWEEKGSARGFSDEEWYSTLANAARTEELIARHSTIMDRYDPQKKVGLVL